MNVIRCDEKEYLVWKWRPEGQDVNSTSRENAIRYGSSLRVKDGEVAVFVYKQKDGTCQDYIVGPYDDIIKTANFPVLAGIVGMAFGGESPFQAEVYFINLAGNNQIRFAVPYFDVFDPRLPDHGVPMAVRGTLTFNLTNHQEFIKLNRLVNFDLEDEIRYMALVIFIISCMPFILVRISLIFAILLPPNYFLNSLIASIICCVNSSVNTFSVSISSTIFACFASK